MAVPFTKAEYVTVETKDEFLPTATPMIQVVAPANLPEGYSFQAEAAPGQTFTVVVPPGGVEEGQSFTVPCYPPSDPNTFSVPVGAWRDSLCNCCAYGCCHPHLCLAYWCQPLALAQVMVRMRLSWLGGPTSISGVAGTYRIIVILTAVYWSVYTVLTITYNGIVTAAAPEGTPTADDVTSLVVEPLPKSAVIISNIRSLLPIAYWVYMIVLLIRTRMAVRAKYAIPDKCCPGCEDVVCAICCGCCTTMQMSRHTAEYDKYASQCCTETGLPAHVKSMA